MLPKKQRIPKALAREVFIRGMPTHSPHFLLRIEKSTRGQSLFAVSISKKVASTAVLRNRTRRRVYSALRSFVPKVAPGFLVAFTVKKGGETLPFEKIEEEVKSLLLRVKLL